MLDDDESDDDEGSLGVLGRSGLRLRAKLDLVEARLRGLVERAEAGEVSPSLLAAMREVNAELARIHAGQVVLCVELGLDVPDRPDDAGRLAALDEIEASLGEG